MDGGDWKLYPGEFERKEFDKFAGSEFRMSEANPIGRRAGKPDVISPGAPYKSASSTLLSQAIDTLIYGLVV